MDNALEQRRRFLKKYINPTPLTPKPPPPGVERGGTKTMTSRLLTPQTLHNKEEGPRTAKLALMLIKSKKNMELYEYLEESPNCVYLPKIYC